MQSLHPLRIYRQMGPDLKRLLVSDILIRFCEQIPYAFVVVWCMKEIGVSAVQFGALTSIEMVTAILIYVPVAYLVEREGAQEAVHRHHLRFFFTLSGRSAFVALDAGPQFRVFRSRA